MREITGSFNAIWGAMKGSIGKVVTEGKEVNEKWHKNTEVLCRRDPNVNDIFVETGYEDEPEVLESGVKGARHVITIRTNFDGLTMS